MRVSTDCLYVAQTVKNPPAVQETWVRSLGQEDPLGKEMATRSSIFAWRIPWTEEPGGLQSRGSRELETPEWLAHTLGGEMAFEQESGLLSGSWSLK